MIEEVWKFIPSYEGRYQVSNMGRIRSVDRVVSINGKRGSYEKHVQPRIIAQRKNRGYPYVSLSKNGKIYAEKVHRCVCLAFIDNPKGYIDVNHKNGDRSDNRVENLEWCTRQYNIWHSYYVTHRKPSGCKKVMCIENGIAYPSCMAAGRDLNLKSSGHIADVANGVYKQYKGYHFKFID